MTLVEPNARRTERRAASRRRQEANTVLVTPLREIIMLRVKRGETTLTTVGVLLGWEKKPLNRHPGLIGDKARVERVLGLRECPNPARKLIRYDIAVHFARALDIDPVDIGV